MEVREIPVGLIEVGEQRIRSLMSDEGLQCLLADIATRGLMQPIGVCVRGDGRFQLLWGLRRLTCARKLGWSVIPAHVVERDVESVRAWALVENVQREDLSLEDEVACVQQLVEVEGRSIREVAELLNRSAEWVRRRLAFAHLPVDVRVEVYEGKIPVGMGEALALVEDVEVRAWLLERAKIEKWSVDDVRAMVRAVLAAGGLREAVEAGVAAAESVAPGVECVPSVPCEVCGSVVELGQVVVVRVCRPCVKVVRGG